MTNNLRVVLFAGSRRERKSFRFLMPMTLLFVGLGWSLTAYASSFTITPIFDSSITTNAQAGAIEADINTAIGTIEGLYSNNVTYDVDFSYTSAGTNGYLLRTTANFYDYSYANYTTALKADAAANPGNLNLTTAIASLSAGNDSSGSGDMAIVYGDALMLSDWGLTTPTFLGNDMININSDQPFAITGSADSTHYDLIGGLEHELNETMGGGGAGSTLTFADPTTCTVSNFFCGKYGATDLYRYSAPATTSFTTSGTASSYLSLDGGVTEVVPFNQNSAGDFGDFGPDCGNSPTGVGQNGSNPGNDQYIQNALNCTGQDEAYTILSPEYTMQEGIGWDPSAAVGTPEPGTLVLLGVGLLALLALSKWSKRRKEDYAS